MSFSGVILANWWKFFLVFLNSYLLGSLNFSIIVVNFFHRSGVKTDIRNEGSGNAGFTNVLRSVGIKKAIFTFIGDFLKGFLSVFITKAVLCKLPYFGENSANLLSMMFISLFLCTLGHIFPCFFGFRGGKGILTTWAAILPINFSLFLVLITVFLIIVYFTKIVSLASIVVTIAFPILNLIIELFKNLAVVHNLFYFSFIILLPFITSSLVLYEHRGNFARLLAGTEGSINFKRK